MAPLLRANTRPDLITLDDQLLDRGFGFLLSILPRQIFKLHLRDIVINPRLVPFQDKGASVVFARFLDSESIEVDVDASGNVESSPSASREKRVRLVNLCAEHERALNQVVPMQWTSDNPDYQITQERTDHIRALILYFLLRWASDNSHTFSLPQPNYAHLCAAFARLKGTAHYLNREVIYEDEERIDVQMNVVNGMRSTAAEYSQHHDRQSSTAARHTEQNFIRPDVTRLRLDLSADLSNCDQSIEVPQKSVADTGLSTPDPSLKHPSPKPENFDITSQPSHIVEVPVALLLQSSIAKLRLFARKMITPSPALRLDSADEMLLDRITFNYSDQKFDLQLPEQIYTAEEVYNVFKSGSVKDHVKFLAPFSDPHTRQILELELSKATNNKEEADLFHGSIQETTEIRETSDLGSNPDHRPTTIPAIDYKTSPISGVKRTATGREKNYAVMTPEHDNTIMPGVEGLAKCIDSSNTIATPERDTTVVDGIEETTSNSETSDTVTTQENDAQARQSLPTPETLTEEAPSTEADPIMARLKKEVGVEMLSLLPDINALTFKKIHHTQPGFLSIRLLLGTLNDETRPQLDGSEIWASFKMHDKGARAAPRMHAHAFRATTDEVLDEDLKVNTVLPNLKMAQPFRGVHGEDRKEELQLKALVKYYFMLAAKAQFLGFTKHYMPFNSSFVNELKLVCKRLQSLGSSEEQQRTSGRPTKRLKRLDSRTSGISSLSDTDNDVFIAARTRDAHRSGRRTQPSSAAVSESEDYVTPIPKAPQRIPRRFALGSIIYVDSHFSGRNEYLYDDADLQDSDGESGDEIPGPICSEHDALLLKRKQMNLGLECQRESVRRSKAKKESATMGMRKIRGMLNSTADPLVRENLQGKLKLREQALWCAQSQLVVHEGALNGFKKRRKEINEEASWVDPRIAEAWEAMH